jgi:hypothetical protein
MLIMPLLAERSQPFCTTGQFRLLLALHVQPGANRSHDGPHGGRLKIRISAPPADEGQCTPIDFAGLFEAPARQAAAVVGPVEPQQTGADCPACKLLPGITPPVD